MYIQVNNVTKSLGIKRTKIIDNAHTELKKDFIHGLVVSLMQIFGIKKNKVIDNVSMELESGKVYGLSGINGSGKTMMMRLLCGLLVADKGEVIIDGKKIGKDIDFPNSVGLLIENPAFLGDYSGFENLKKITEITGEADTSDIINAIERVGLDPYDDKKVKKYSLGMKQRLGIAMAIVGAPELVILDEPTNALDSTGVEKVKQIISEERKRGALVVVSCHDKNILDQVSDKIFMIENGKVSV